MPKSGGVVVSVRCVYCPHRSLTEQSDHKRLTQVYIISFTFQ